MLEFLKKIVPIFGIDFPMWSFFAAGLGLILIIVIIILIAAGAKKRKAKKAKAEKTIDENIGYTVEKNKFFDMPLENETPDELLKDEAPLLEDADEPEIFKKPAPTPIIIKNPEKKAEPIVIKKVPAKDADVRKEPQQADKRPAKESDGIRSRFVIDQSSDGRFRFCLISGNNSKIALSESYSSRQTCENGINAVKNNINSPIEDRTVEEIAAQKNPKYEIFNDKEGKFYFYLKAGNGELILKSEPYVTKAGCIKCIDSIKTIAPISPIKD